MFSIKYAPKHLDEFDLKDINIKNIKHIPHTIIYGDYGVGKMTLSQLWLGSIFGNNIYHLKNYIQEYKVSNRMIELSIFYSNYHYIINPCLYGLYDKHFLQQFIGDLCTNTNISHSFDTEKLYKIIVIQNADQLTINAQNALRSTMEKNIYTCRFIFLCHSYNKMIEPIISRCLKIKIPTPSTNSMCNLLKHICITENIEIDNNDCINNTNISIEDIANASDGNYRSLFNLLENVLLVENKKDINLESFDDALCVINEIVNKVNKERNLNIMLDIRNNIYKLLITCQHTNQIFKTLLLKFLKLFDKVEDKRYLINICHEYQYKSLFGNSWGKD